MIRPGMRLRAARIALRIRWIDEVERQRDAAVAAREEAIRQRDDARAARARWHVEVAALTGLDLRTTKVDDMEGLLARLRVVLGDGARAQVTADDARAMAEEAENEQRVANRELSAVREWAISVLGEDDTAVWGPGPLVDQVGRAVATQVSEELTQLTAALAARAERAEARLRAKAADPVTILDAWLEVRRLVGDDSGIISPASIVDRVAVAVEERRARSRDGMTATCPMCRTSQDLVVAEHTTSIEDGPGSENPPHTCWGSGIEAEHLPADVGGDGVVDVKIACGREVQVEVGCGDDDDHDGPCWPSPMSLAQRALNAAAVNRPDLLDSMRQVWAVVSASVTTEPGPDPVTELSQVRDAVYAAGRPVERGGFHPGRTVEAVRAALAPFIPPSVMRDLTSGQQPPREAYDPAMGGDIEPPPGRSFPTGTGPARPGDRPVEQRLAVALEEIEMARAVLAPEVDTTGTPLHTLAADSIDRNRKSAVATELRWWIAPGNSHAMAYGADADDMRTRAERLDPGGVAHMTADGQPPRPDVFAADRELSEQVPF